MPCAKDIHTRGENIDRNAVVGEISSPVPAIAGCDSDSIRGRSGRVVGGVELTI